MVALVTCGGISLLEMVVMAIKDDQTDLDQKNPCERFHDKAICRPLFRDLSFTADLAVNDGKIMRLLNHILALALFLSCAFGVIAAEAVTGEPAHAAVEVAAEGQHGGGEHKEHKGLPPDAPVFDLGPIQITSSMVVTWIVAIGLIVFAQVATRNIQMVPSGLQNFAEWLVESLYEFFEGILGKDLVKRSFWFFCTIFLFILATNWFGLVPGVGTIGHGHTDAAGHFEVTRPFLRGGNADLNMTLAMSLVYFFLWLVWSFQSLGFVGFFKHLFGGGGGSKGFMAVFMTAIFIFVGLIEVISIAFRPVSLSFRLYGNIFAGENILESMMTLVPWLGWILPLPFYFLELLVGLVQALVFALLTSVFTALMCAHHEEAHGDAHGAEHSGGHAH